MWPGQETLRILSDRELCERFLSNPFGYRHVSRLAFLQELKTRGEKVLDAIGWPRQDSAIYQNVYTGDTSKYADLFLRWENRDFWFFAVLDDWKPYQPPQHFRNPYEFEDAKPRKHQSANQMSLF